MNKINAFLIQEERGYHASFKLLKATLCRAGFTIHHLGAKPPKDIPWKWEPQDSKPTLFLGSLLFDKYALSGDEKERWAEYIKEAICRGAGLVTMLDESTVGVLSRLSTKLDAYTEDVKIPVATDTQAYGITFRPLLTETGKGHDATKWLADKELPPFGSLNRSYYRTLARKDATVLMEVPESVDQKPTMIEDLVKHGIAGNYVVGETYPFVVVRNRIAIMAADWSYTGGREFIRWPHASIWLAGLGRWVVGRDMKDMSSPAMSATPVYWFLNYDCQETVPNWQWIKGKLSTPVEAPTAPVKGVVQASLGSRQVTDLPCGDAPVVSEKNGILEAKLCNRIVVRLNKAAMQAGYRLDQPAGNGVVVADDSTESKPAHMLSPWKCAEYVEPPRIEGASLVVTYNLYSDENKQKQTGTLSWTFTPAVKEIEGTKWHCVGEKFALSSDIDVERFISPPHRWRLGGAAEDHWTQRFACYGAKRGFFQTRFDKEGFMFSLCSHLISDLDKGKSVLEVSNELREHFKEKGVTLSDKATVGVELAGSKWLIADADQKYYIRSNDQHQLNVYQETTSEPFYWFHSGQPFQMLTYKGKDEARTLWCYTTTPACVRSEVRRPPTCNYIDIDLQVALGRQSGKIELPIFWYCFVEQGFDHNLWLAAYDYVRQYFLSKFNIERTYPRPTAMLRYNVMYLNDLKNYADTFVPLAKELGFKRIDCGVRYVNDLFFPLHGRIEALRYLCKKAYEAGIEVIFYCGASWHHERDSQLATAKKPEEDYCDDPQLVPGTIEGSSWRIKNDDGKNIVWSNPNNQSECHEVDGLKRKVVLLGLDTRVVPI